MASVVYMTSVVLALVARVDDIGLAPIQNGLCYRGYCSTTTQYY